MRKQDYYWYWLTNINGIGRRTIQRLLDIYGTPEAVYWENEEKISACFRNIKQKEAFSMSKREDYIIHSYQKLAGKGISFIHRDMQCYPKKLRDIPDAPFSLYLKGSFPPENQKNVAVIGARNCTRYGSEIARFFARELSKYGIGIISGLARGIDGMAHAGALEEEGYTLGVLGCGIDRIYPEENYRLFMQMEKTGGILSENNLGILPAPGLFPQRNRLIAGLSDGILVVEAMEKSGTFITVDQGLEQGREIFALPGRITDKTSAGCNNLIKLGAHMITEVEDILEILQINRKNVQKSGKANDFKAGVNKMSLAPLEKMVYSCLRIEPKYLDDIINEAKIAPQEVCVVLNRLSVRGVIVETARNYYAIKL